MTDPDVDLIEAMARAMVAVSGADPEQVIPEVAPLRRWQVYLLTARAALAVARPRIWREAMEAAACIVEKIPLLPCSNAPPQMPTRREIAAVIRASAALSPPATEVAKP